MAKSVNKPKREIKNKRNGAGRNDEENTKTCDELLDEREEKERAWEKQERAREAEETRAWLEEDKAVEEHYKKIKAAWQKQVSSIIETGQFLIQAKEDLTERFGHGTFGELFSEVSEHELPFSWRTANKLMRVARHPILSNSTHESNLPPCWATLHVLSHIAAPRLERLIAEKAVNSGMTREQAERLANKLPNLVVKALTDLIHAMHEYPIPVTDDDDGDEPRMPWAGTDENPVKTLVSELRAIRDEEHEEHGVDESRRSGRKLKFGSFSYDPAKWGPFDNVQFLPAWIAELSKAWDEAEQAERLIERQRKKKSNEKEARVG